MAMYKRATAAGSVAASATANVLSGDQVQIAPYPRTVKGIAVTVRDNTPALGDITYVLKAGSQEIARGRGMLERTAGAEILYPDDFEDVGMVVGASVPLNLEITNADSGAAHGVQFAILFDRL